jgi:hypothetical protein
MQQRSGTATQQVETVFQPFSSYGGSQEQSMLVKVTVNNF